MDGERKNEFLSSSSSSSRPFVSCGCGCHRLFPLVLLVLKKKGGREGSKGGGREGGREGGRDDLNRPRLLFFPPHRPALWQRERDSAPLPCVPQPSRQERKVEEVEKRDQEGRRKQKEMKESKRREKRECDARNEEEAAVAGFLDILEAGG